MKLLFLDMDGVLNSEQSAHYFWWKKHDRQCYMQEWAELDPICCSNLNKLLEELPDCKVVISSTWRTHFELEEWDKHADEYFPALKGRIIGKTPVIRESFRGFTPRGVEITQWLKDNGHSDTPFVILDDNADMEGCMVNLVQTDPNVGLTWDDIKAVLNLFAVLVRDSA